MEKDLAPIWAASLNGLEGDVVSGTVVLTFTSEAGAVLRLRMEGVATMEVKRSHLGPFSWNEVVDVGVSRSKGLWTLGFTLSESAELEFSCQVASIEQGGGATETP